MRTQRQLKVGEEIRHAISMIFQRDDVPWPYEYKAPMITLSEVQVSPDLKNATVFFTTIQTKKVKSATKHLNEMAGFFRHQVSQAVRLRYTPRINFKIDTSFEYADNIDKILQKPEVARDIDAGKASEDQEDQS